MNYTVFDMNTGRVLRVFDTDSIAQVAIQSRANHEIVLEGEHPDHLWHWGDQEPALRPPVLPFSERTIEAGEVLSLDVPHGTGVIYELTDQPLNRLGRFPRETAVIDDGNFAFKSGKLGTFTFIFLPPFPFLQEHELQVIVNAV